MNCRIAWRHSRKNIISYEVFCQSVAKRHPLQSRHASRVTRHVTPGKKKKSRQCPGELGDGGDGVLNVLALAESVAHARRGLYARSYAGETACISASLRY